MAGATGKESTAENLWSLDISQLKEGEVVKENFGAEEEIYTLNSVYFLNPQMGWVVGEYGTVIKTTDGGKTWEKLKSGTGNTLLEVDFFDQNFGFAVGLDATILKTVDGGKTWTAESPNKKTHYYGVTFRRGGPDTSARMLLPWVREVSPIMPFLKSSICRTGWRQPR